ncbi:DUF11 domain-containing protein [Microbacterium sp. SSW1-49]|uniref:DUF11 domain-containing protein n=1 Tax=Microbacterium croceum TaxID=2851645 RepID=A0ABT0F944_9MICO|nr:isopeptide-forming domain-containing fimbrial protein [Microbacterium croceum]MCK2034565.1 DUF11 domain-containing protein [Microbacterium croceum]
MRTQTQGMLERAARPGGRVGRMLLAMLAIVALGLGLQTPVMASADATSVPSISITPLTPASQPSGTAFGYRVSYTCSNVNASPCAESPTVTIPLGAAANPAWTVKVGANPLITSWTVTGGNLVIRLADLTEGVAGTIGITITPPNHTTPNGTSWTLTPTMTFTDGTPTVSAPGVTSTATAIPSIQVQKSVEQTFYKPGDTVKYTLWWTCPRSNLGVLGDENLSSLRLVDTLPAGLTYLSSSPSATVAGQTLTFDLTAAQLGSSCSASADAPVPVTVNARVNANVADNTVLRNVVNGTGTSISGTTLTGSGEVSVTVVSTLPGATVTKRGYGPLLNTVGDSGTYDLNLNGYTSATYPGPWLGRGDANVSTSTIYNSAAPSFRIEALYALDVLMPGPGLQSEVVDPVPCTTNVSGTSYSSNAPGTVCTDPAFHPTMVTIWARTTENPQNVGIPSAFAPQARLTDGSIVTLTAGPIPSSAAMLANGPGHRSYFVPASAIGRVAEIILPRTTDMTNTRMNVVIGGYADSRRAAGDILRNQAAISSYAVGATTPYATGTSSVGRIFILDGPQIGVTKYWYAAGSEFRVNSEVMLKGPTTGDLTFVDRFPAGVSFTGPAVLDAYRYGAGAWSFNIPTTTTVTADPVTGETIVTVVVKAATVNSLLPASKGERIRFEVHLPSKVQFPGNYVNRATVNLSDPQVNNSICTQGTKVAGTTGAGHQCASSTSFTVNPDPTSDAVRLTKTVRGSLDTAFKSFPAIGYVASAGGNATYRLNWTNKSQQNVGNVVMYDLLPRVGDTGTVAGTVNQQRGSTFRPILTGLSTLPAGVTAFYSTSTNPCRPEVLPNAQNPDCVDDWVAMPASPSAALLQTVRALRFVSTATYAFDQGLAIDLTMTTPALNSAGDVAWNTVATAQTNLSNGQPIKPVESAKVGIAREDFSHITIDKVVDKTTANVGDTLTYTVTAVNDGGRDLTDITLRDTLPEGATFVSASGGGTYANGVVTWNLATMPLGQLFSYTVTAKVAKEGTTLVNRWGVDGPTPVTPLHPCPAPNDDEESCATTTVPSVALTFAKTSVPAAGSIVKPGDTVAYTVKVTNATATASTAGKVTDDMSDVLDKATLVAPPTVTCAPTANSCGQVDYTAGDDSFTWSSSVARPLAANTSATITYTVRVGDDASGTLRNLLVEPDIAVEHPILQVDKVVDKGAGALVNPGDDVTYTLSIANTGAVASGSFSVFDDLSDVVDNATFDPDSISISPAVGTAAYDAGTRRLTWTGALAAGQSVQVSYTVTVDDDAFGELRNAFVDKTVVNPISGSLRWDKVDDSADARLLAGAEWTLQGLDENGQPAGATLTIVDCTQAPCGGPDKDAEGGQFLVPGLVPGGYQLIETKAPVGFVRDDTPRTVLVHGDTQVTVLDDIVNRQQPAPVLPFTGGLGTEHLLAIGAALLLLTAGLAGWRRIRRRTS